MRLIDADALINEIMKNRCADCDRRKGIKRRKMTFVYDFGEAPCRACDVGDMIDILDEAPTIDSWISVKDRLPEQAGLKCLVLAKFIDGTYSKFTAFSGYGHPGWWTYEIPYMEGMPNNRVHHNYKVTHWMPLPEPPEMQKEAKE